MPSALYEPPRHETRTASRYAPACTFPFGPLTRPKRRNSGLPERSDMSFPLNLGPNWPASYSSESSEFAFGGRVKFVSFRACTKKAPSVSNAVYQRSWQPACCVRSIGWAFSIQLVWLAAGGPFGESVTARPLWWKSVVVPHVLGGPPASEPVVQFRARSFFSNSSVNTSWNAGWSAKIAVPGAARSTLWSLSLEYDARRSRLSVASTHTML